MGQCFETMSEGALCCVTYSTRKEVRIIDWRVGASAFCNAQAKRGQSA